MEKIYLFSIDGIIYAVTEDGYKILSSVLCGFAQEPNDIQEKYLIKTFQELTYELKTYYNVINILSDSDKEELACAIKKLINHSQRRDIEFWEKHIMSIREPSFDFYNKNIWQKIVLKPTV